MAFWAKVTALVAAVLGGLFVLVGGAVSANAHPGHQHPAGATATPALAAAALVADEREKNQSSPQEQGASADLNGATGNAAPEPLRAPCCCGGIACHAGVAPLMAIVIPPELANSFDVTPVLVGPVILPGGIERPPRVLISL